ncbi:polyphenol oxidase family protein [Patescibacteria group bacterium]|nr:polyphenol oxidase family protein [Patescibacteria group bacterium]
MIIITKFIGKAITVGKILNYERLKKFSYVGMEQTHSENFIEIFEVEKNKQVIPNVDALITAKKNILLAVKTADCLPILIHWKNPQEKDVIAAIHSGRAGTEKKILTKVLNYLKIKYGASETPKNKSQESKLTIWLGPAICNKCYQINKESNLHYDLYQKNIDQIKQVFPKSKNLNTVNTVSNESTNSPIDIKIIRSEFCTLHNNEMFHSYRKSGTGVAMNYSLIGMK